MNDLIELEKKIVPEMIETLEKRYEILRSIYYYQPIGRRALANNLKLGERTVRTEVSVLKEQGLLNIESVGMYVTEEGKSILMDLKDVIYNIKGLKDLERVLEDALNIKKAFIVPGNSDEDELVLKDIGKEAAKHLKKLIRDDNIIGITGGTTMEQFAEEVNSEKVANNVLVLPARGGLGKSVETQANSIAAKLANKIGGSYRLLHVPDIVGKEAQDALLKIPDVREIVSIIHNLDILVFGLGRADTMAERRELPEEKIHKLIENGAVAEAFGHYFDRSGNTVYESMTIGLSLSDYERVKNVIGVAGGEEKAEAIISICTIRGDMTLVTDEGAARKILSIEKNKLHS